MAKFPLKLKRHNKGKSWSKGRSSTSNPQKMKHRQKAKSRFFQANLSLAPIPPVTNPNALTLDAVLKHDQRQAFNSETTTVNDVFNSLYNFNITDGDENMPESQPGTLKTFKTFASNYSTCRNISFKKLLTNFRTSSELHKEMLAILNALTVIIKERGGTESSTEYFILLMEQIEASTEDTDIIAGISLLAMGIKTMPPAVLRKRFSATAQTLLEILQRFIESNSQSIIKNTIGCLSVLLRAQDYTTWTYSSTWQYIDAILSFTIHSKPKIRKAAQHAIISIVHGSSFMQPEKAANGEDASTENTTIKPKFYPAGSRIAKFCLNQFKPEVLANSQTTVLHTLTPLKDVLSGFKTEDIRTICEHLLSTMTASNVLVRTNSFQALFASRTLNLNGDLCAKFIAAIHDYRPDRIDVRQTLAWITVLKEGHIHFAALDLSLCMNALPHLFDVCVNDLWMSDRAEIIAGVSNSIKAMLYDCVKPASATKDTTDIHRVPISRIISLLHKVLNVPFGDIGASKLELEWQCTSLRRAIWGRREVQCLRPRSKEKEKEVSMAHTYELLCCQLWGLFPDFCRQPKDPENFRLIAPTLGNALDNNPEFRAPIYDGLIELLQNEQNTVIHEALGEVCKELFTTYQK